VKELTKDIMSRKVDKPADEEDEEDDDFEYDATQPSVMDIVRPLNLGEEIAGMTVIDTAAFAGHKEIVQYLRPLPGCSGVSPSVVTVIFFSFTYLSHIKEPIYFCSIWWTFRFGR
jgi:hypothetical protein